MLNEKTKLGIGILAAVLITTAVLVPVSIYTDRAIRSDGGFSGVTTTGYDDGVTSTGTRQDAWMGIDVNEETGSMDGTLVQNGNYQSVADPESMIDVVKSSDGVGYLSLSEVNRDDELKALTISEDHGETYIATDSTDYISAPLNMVMKVPANVAKVLKAHDYSAEVDTALNPTDLNDSELLEEGYGDWLVKNEYQKQFAVAFIIFQWTVHSQAATEELAASNLVSPNGETADKADTASFKKWIVTTFADTDDYSWGVVKDGDLAIEHIELKVDGTGTDQFALDQAISSFNKEFEDEGVVVQQLLNDGGSYRAWETDDEASVPPGVTYNYDEYDQANNGDAGTFLGTQSRGIETYDMVDESSEDAGEISYWGYDEDIYSKGSIVTEPENVSDIDNVFYDYSKVVASTENTPLAATIAGDNIVFYTSADASFELPDGTEGHPTGLSREAAKGIFQYGLSWEVLAGLDLIDYAEKN